MAAITITIPDDKITLIIDSFAIAYGYQDMIQNEAMEMIPNPETKTQFAKRILKNFIQEIHTATKIKELDITRKALIAEAITETSEISVD